MTGRKPIQLEITCIDFPDPALYPNLFVGLVEKKEVVQEAALATAHAAGQMTFTTRLEALPDEGGESVKFYGPAAQGPPHERFVYLSWRRQTPEGWQLTSRIKLPLAIFSTAQVARALEDNQPLRLQAQMRDGKGRPAAATLRGSSLSVLS